MFKPGYVCIHCDFRTVSRDELEDHEKCHTIDEMFEAEMTPKEDYTNE